jgi:hypothetical protein
MEGLMAARVLVASNAPLGAVGEALDRFSWEIDLALWALTGRSPEQALARLNRASAAAPNVHPLRNRVLSVLALGPTTIATISEILAEDPADVDAALTEAAFAGLVDADDPPPPAPRSAMTWWRTRRHLSSQNGDDR